MLEKSVTGFVYIVGTISGLKMTIHVCVAVASAAIQMVTNATSVAETVGSVQVCAEITGVTECAVTTTVTLGGTTKTGMYVHVRFLGHFLVLTL